MSLYFKLLIVWMLLGNSHQVIGQSVENELQTPSISTISLTTTDADKAVSYLNEILDSEELDITTSSLTDRQRWIRLSNNGLELRFTTALNSYELNLHYARIKRFDLNMTIYTDWMDTHAAIRLDSLDTVLEKLISQSKNFLGPFKKEDGVYQIVVSIPGADYLRFESLTKPDKIFKSEIISWQQLMEKSRHYGSNILDKSSAYGGKEGDPFDDTKHLVASDTISYVYAEWYGWITKFKIGYHSGLEIEHGQNPGKISRHFDLETDELIISATICQATILKPTKVSAMILTSNHGRKFEFGETNRKHDCHWVQIPPKSFVAGFFGRSGEEIDQLGVIYSPIFQEASVPD
jgi:hypothetical protein